MLLKINLYDILTHYNNNQKLIKFKFFFFIYIIYVDNFEKIEKKKKLKS